jgi:hypothetical protein
MQDLLSRIIFIGETLPDSPEDVRIASNREYFESVQEILKTRPGIWAEINRENLLQNSSDDYIKSMHRYIDTLGPWETEIKYFGELGNTEIVYYARYIPVAHKVKKWFGIKNENSQP